MMYLDKEELEEKLAVLKSKPKPSDIMDAMELEDAIRDIEVLLGNKSNVCNLDDDECLSCGS